MGIFSNTRFGSVFHKRSPQVTNPPSGAQNFVLCLAWVLAGVLTVLVPLIYRTKKMNDYKEIYNMWNWEDAQKAYEEQRNQYYENQYANQYNQGNYNWEQMTGNYDINQCKWWQLNCFPYYINENGEPQPEAGWYPSWFSGWTISEEEREQMLENGETSPVMHFIYAWQIIMFLAILIYGFFVIRQNRIVTGLVVALVVFANMCFLSMWMLADGSIITDGEYVQQTGFYGQFSVLMFITNAWYVIFGIIFAVIFSIRGHNMHDPNATPAKESTKDGITTEYKAMDEAPSASDAQQENSVGDDYVKVV